VLETSLRAEAMRDDLDAALKTAAISTSICQKLELRSKLARVAQVIAHIRIHRQQFKEVLRDAKALLDACQKQGDKHGEAHQWLSIATARLEQVRVTAPLAQPQEILTRVTEGKPAFPMKRVMEALMAAKEALQLFRRLGSAHGEASSLQALAKIHRFKQEPPMAVEAARESAAIFRSIGEGHGQVHSLLVEALAHLSAVGTGWDAKDDESSEGRQSSSEKQALAAAEEAARLSRYLKDAELEDYSKQVLNLARECLRAPYAPEKAHKQMLIAIDSRERSSLEDLGFRFRPPSEAAMLLRDDPRWFFRQRLGADVPELPMQKGKDLAMERLLSMEQSAQPISAA